MYFDIPIQDDIMYLLEEIGNNCKVNNINAKAIVNNTNNEYDDKRIITNEKISRGDYVEYNDLFFLVVDDVVDKRYKTYYKSKMRRCNFDVKFIIDKKLYLFYSIIEGDKFYINENKVMDISADTITVTLPATDVTRQIQKLQSFIKFGQKWQIQGIDYTKVGLITLHCKITTSNDTIDDMENEIADRWVDGKDVLDGNITPIMPFEEVTTPTEKAVVTFYILDRETEEFISDAIINLQDAEGNILKLLNGQSYEIEKQTYTYTVEKEGYEAQTNTIIVDSDINKVIFLEKAEEEPPEGEDNFTYEIVGEDEIMWNMTETYVVKKYNNGIEVDGKFTFALEGEYADITNYTDNTVDIKARSSGFGYVTLTATDVETNEIVEKQILVMGLF